VRRYLCVTLHCPFHWALLYMSAGLLWGQEWHVHCSVTGCWICSPAPLSPPPSSSEPVDEINLQDWWQPAGCWYFWDCDSTGTHSETHIYWHSVTISLHCRQCQQLIHILHLATANATSCLVELFYADNHRTVKCWLGRNSLSMQHSALDLSTAPNSEKWNTIGSS
jgi:hypothetical protein